MFVMDFYPAPKSQMLGKGEGGTDIGLMDKEVQIVEALRAMQAWLTTSSRLRRSRPRWPPEPWLPRPLPS